MNSRYRPIGGMGDELDREGGETFHAVRVPFLSRELLILGVVLAVGGLAYGLSGELRPAAHAARNSLSGHDKLIESVMFSGDGRTLISCGWDNKVRIWNVDDDHPEWGREIATLPHSSHLFTMALTPDSRHLATGSTQGFAIWTNRGGAAWENVLEESGLMHRCVAASPDSRSLAVGGSDGAIRFWDLETLKQTFTLPAFSDEVRSLAFTADGSLLVGSAFDGTLRVWRLNPGKSPEMLRLDCGTATTFALSPREPLLVTSYGEGTASGLSLWDLPSGRERARLQGCELGNNAMVFSRDGRLLACGDKDNVVRLREASSGKLVANLDNDMGWVKTLAFSPDGRRIAFGGRDTTIRFRDVPREVTRLVGTGL